MCLGLCATRGTGSQRTLRWRKTDSNLRFPIIRCRFQDGRPVSHDGLMVSRPGTRSSNPVPSSGESVSLPQPVSKGRQPRLSARVCAAGLETGSAETHGVFRYRANRRQYLCRTIFQYRSAAGGLLALPIGWHRARAEHSAGIRTFPLVAMAAFHAPKLAVRDTHLDRLTHPGLSDGSAEADTATARAVALRSVPSANPTGRISRGVRHICVKQIMNADRELRLCSGSL